MMLFEEATQTIHMRDCKTASTITFCFTTVHDKAPILYQHTEGYHLTTLSQTQCLAVYRACLCIIQKHIALLQVGQANLQSAIQSYFTPVNYGC